MDSRARVHSNNCAVVRCLARPLDADADCLPRLAAKFDPTSTGSSDMDAPTTAPWYIIEAFWQSFRTHNSHHHHQLRSTEKHHHRLKSIKIEAIPPANMKLSAIFLTMVAIAPSALAAPVDFTTGGQIGASGLSAGLTHVMGETQVSEEPPKKRCCLRNGLIYNALDEDTEEAAAKEKRQLRNGLIYNDVHDEPSDAK